MHDIYYEALGIQRCNSADHTSPDGFLDCLRSKIITNNHGSTAQACDNLAQCGTSLTEAKGKPGMPTLWGHANEGFIVTGTGQVGVSPDKYVTTWNQSYWEPEFRKVAGRYQVVTLNGCHPGAGIDGAELLYQIARIVGCVVRGPTGFLYCGDRGIWLEDGAVYQIATPTHKPNPIQPPTPHFEVGYTMLQINTTQGLVSIDESLALEVTISRMKLGKPQSAVTLSGKDVRMFLDTVDFTTPMEIAGQPAALLTALITLKVVINKSETQRQFLVFNDRLLADKDFPTVYYRVSPSLRTLLDNV